MKIENEDQAKAVALYEFRKLYPFGVKVKMSVSRMSEVWIVRMTWGSPVREYEYRIDAGTGQAWKIK